MPAIATPHHRVSVATAHIHDELDSVADASVWSMDEQETGQVLVALARAEARLTELKARVAAHADDIHVGSEVAASSAANWLAHETKQTRAATHRTMRLGHSLDARPQTREALAAGTVCEEQARVMIAAVDRVPVEYRDRAEATSSPRPPITTPRHCGCSARDSSRSSTLLPPTPPKRRSSNAKSERP